MKQTISAGQVLSVRNRTLPVSEEWRGCLGDEIARNGTVFFWGQSGNGKSSAVMSFAKMLTASGRVLYVSREEGYSLSFQNTLSRLGMAECGADLQVIDNESLETLKERLSKQRSPDFIIIDSVQVMGLSYRDFLELRKAYPRKLFVLVSQVYGKQPDGRSAMKMMYDADLKIWVEGHTAFSKGRFIGSTGKYVIWKEGADRYWEGKKKENNTQE
jgi:hypothetical protein